MSCIYCQISCTCVKEYSDCLMWKEDRQTDRIADIVVYREDTRRMSIWGGGALRLKQIFKNCLSPSRDSNALTCRKSTH